MERGWGRASGDRGERVGRGAETETHSEGGARCGIDHMSTVHEGKKPFSCSTCDAKFTTSQSVRYHVKSVHEGKGLQLPCPHCDLIFRHKSNLSNHIRNIHENVKTETYDHKIKSEIPDNVYETENHNDDLDYFDFEYSGKVTIEEKEGSLIEMNGLKQETDLKLCESAKDNENDPFKDLQSNCLEKEHLSDSNIKNQNVQEGEQSNIHQCGICSYSCARKSDMTRHIASVHEKIKPHKCPICDYRSYKRYHVKNHVLTVHKGKRPFKCSDCEVSFTSTSSLKYHNLAVHEGKKPFY